MTIKLIEFLMIRELPRWVEPMTNVIVFLVFIALAVQVTPPPSHDLTLEQANQMLNEESKQMMLEEAKERLAFYKDKVRRYHPDTLAYSDLQRFIAEDEQRIASLESGMKHKRGSK